MNRLDRIEAATKDRTPDRHGVWFVTVREDDLRALVMLARASKEMEAARLVWEKSDAECFKSSVGWGKAHDAWLAALAALEEPCEP